MSRRLLAGATAGVKCGHLALERHAWTWDGDGLTSDERVLWRARRALVELVTVLLHDEAFVTNLRGVRSALKPRARAWEVARRYGTGHRRRLVAALFMRGAEHENLDDAGVTMCNLGATAVTSADDSRTTRRGTYLIGDAFLASIEYGCVLLAAKGRGQALNRSEERHVRRMIATILHGVPRSSLAEIGP
jgi:hypothetical protein